MTRSKTFVFKRKYFTFKNSNYTNLNGVEKYVRTIEFSFFSENFNTNMLLFGICAIISFGRFNAKT